MVQHDVEDNTYTVTSVEYVRAVLGLPNAPLTPAIVMGDKIDEDMPLEPLVVQYVKGPDERIAEKASFAPYVNANGSVDGKSMASQVSSITVQPPLRLDLNPQILIPKYVRPNKKGVFGKGTILMHQISRAATEGVDIVLVGLGVNPCILITSPLTPQGVAHIVNQSAGQHLIWLMPSDVTTATDVLIASMLAVGGQVLQVGNNEAVSVVDTMVWPASVTYLMATQDMVIPPIGQVAPTVNQMANWLIRVAKAHKCMNELATGLIDAAMLVGATWAITPRRPWPRHSSDILRVRMCHSTMC